MYSNHQAIETCKNITYVCSYFKNPCCRYANQGQEDPCGETDCLYWNENYWSWEKPGILRLVVCMLVQFVVQMTFLLCLEKGLFKKLKYWLLRSTQVDNTDQVMNEKLFGDTRKDSDVIKEENRIDRMNGQRKDENEIFIANKLVKHYKNFKAVKGISFVMKKAECFGLLGKL